MFLLFFNPLIRFGMIFKFRPAESYQIFEQQSSAVTLVS
jgi:hypothetical protein